MDTLVSVLGLSSCFCFSTRTLPGQSSFFDLERREDDEEEENEPPQEAIVLPSDSEGKCSPCSCDLI